MFLCKASEAELLKRRGDDGYRDKDNVNKNHFSCIENTVETPLPPTVHPTTRN